jgi:hypothetical protein
LPLAGSNASASARTQSGAPGAVLGWTPESPQRRCPNGHVNCPSSALDKADRTSFLSAKRVDESGWLRGRSPCRRYETIKRFEAEHKDIKLHYQTANWNVATQTFIAASQACNPPDVVGAQSQDNQPLANAGFVADLGQFKYDEWGDFNQAVLREACSVGGKIVAMPVYLTSTGLGYNKALLKEAAITEPPKSDRTHPDTGNLRELHLPGGRL